MWFILLQFLQDCDHLEPTLNLKSTEVDNNITLTDDSGKLYAIVLKKPETQLQNENNIVSENSYFY